MQDRLRRKIEEIRQQPEHVRVWYAWVGVAIVMFFVVVIWIFTLQESFRKAIPETAAKIPSKAGQMKGSGSGSESLEDLSKSGQPLGADASSNNLPQGGDYFDQELTKLNDAQLPR